MAGIGLLATTAAVFGIGLPTAIWPTLGLFSAVVGLLALALLFHPYYAVAIAASVAILAAATMLRGTARAVLGI